MCNEADFSHINVDDASFSRVRYAEGIVCWDKSTVVPLLGSTVVEAVRQWHESGENFDYIQTFSRIEGQIYTNGLAMTVKSDPFDYSGKVFLDGTLLENDELELAFSNQIAASMRRLNTMTKQKFTVISKSNINYPFNPLNDRITTLADFIK